MIAVPALSPASIGCPAGEVHHAPGTIEIDARHAGAVDGWCREAAPMEVPLHAGLEGGGAGVGHDAGDETAVEFGWRVGELDDVHFRPEPAGQRHWRAGPGKLGRARVAPERREEAIGGRASRWVHDVPAGSLPTKQWMSWFEESPA